LLKVAEGNQKLSRGNTFVKRLLIAGSGAPEMHPLRARPSDNVDMAVELTEAGGLAAA
jgi:hypothetical protein